MQPLQQLYTCNHGLMYRVIFLTLYDMFKKMISFKMASKQIAGKPMTDYSPSQGRTAMENLTRNGDRLFALHGSFARIESNIFPAKSPKPFTSKQLSLKHVSPRSTCEDPKFAQDGKHLRAAE